MRAALIAGVFGVLTFSSTLHANGSAAAERAEQEVVRAAWTSATRDLRVCVQGHHDDCRARMWQVVAHVFPEKLGRLINLRTDTSTPTDLGAERNSQFIYQRAPVFRWLSATMQIATCDEAARTFRFAEPLPSELSGDDDALLKTLDEASRELVGLEWTHEARQLARLRERIVTCLQRQ
jgi:hypothetical protein